MISDLERMVGFVAGSKAAFDLQFNSIFTVYGQNIF